MSLPHHLIRLKANWMKTKLILILTLLPVLAGTARAQGTAFTYQGRLNTSGAGANGSYDFTFQIFDARNGGASQSPILTLNGVPVSDGLFAVQLNFGASPFNDGAPRWLQIQVRTNGSSALATLTPRQALTAAPYAITAGTVTGPVGPASLSGMYTNAITFSNANNQFTGSYAGNGVGLTNLVGATVLPPAGNAEITYSWEVETNNPNGYWSVTNKGLIVAGASQTLFQTLTNHLIVTNFGGGGCLYVAGGPGQPALYITKHFSPLGSQRIRGMRVKYFVTTNEANSTDFGFSRFLTLIAGNLQFDTGNVFSLPGQVLHLVYGSGNYGPSVYTNGLGTDYTNEDVASRTWYNPYQKAADNFAFLQNPTANAQLISGWEFTGPRSIRLYTSGQPDVVRTLDYFTNFQNMVDCCTETMEANPENHGIQYCVQSITVYFYSPNTIADSGYYTSSGFQPRSTSYTVLTDTFTGVAQIVALQLPTSGCILCMSNATMMLVCTNLINRNATVTRLGGNN